MRRSPMTISMNRTAAVSGSGKAYIPSSARPVPLRKDCSTATVAIMPLISKCTLLACRMAGV